MKLSKNTLGKLAEMICGASGRGGGYDWDNFPYRSSYYLTRFFDECDLDYTHDGSTRQDWVYWVLAELNELQPRFPSLPPDEMIRVLQHLADPTEFESKNLNYGKALEQINLVLRRDGLQLTFRTGQILVENIRTQVVSSPNEAGRLSQEDETRLRILREYLETASEDEFTEHVLVKLFTALGFRQIRVTGHQDRSMEFGKDMWMTYRLPTRHQLYIGVQAKIGKIHASGSELSGNISGILAQLLMLMTYPVFDSETNSEHLFDHVFLVSSGEITKQARELLSRFLDNTMRRNVMFLDRDDITALYLQYQLPLPGSESSDSDVFEAGDEEIPF